VDIKALLAKMTVEEKVAQLCSIVRWKPVPDPVKEYAKEIRQGIGSFCTVLRPFKAREAAEWNNRIQREMAAKTRLKIPAIIHDEVLHGLMGDGATVYPQAIGLSCSWDPELVRKVASAIGQETRARGISLALSPTINLARDPRCGRTEETYGEDPLLASRFGVAFIGGLQSQGLGATPKHFAANFVGDGGRDSHDIHYSELEMRESYFPAFEAAIREAKAMSIMPAYNSINGVPCSANNWLLNDILRGEWGFNGFTGSDYGGVVNMHNSHGYARDKAEAARKAILGGMDVEYPDPATYPLLAREVRAGRVPRAVLDRSARRVLEAKEQLGLFRNPYANPDRAAALSDTREHRALAREAARRSFVLLKNSGILPLKGVRKLAVLGPNAAVARTGGYSGTGARLVSPLEGIRARFGARVEITHENGCSLLSGNPRDIKKAVAAAKRADAVVLVMGGDSGGSWVQNQELTEGEGRDRSDLRLPGLQEQLIREVSAVNRKTVVVIVNGSAVVTAGWDNLVGAVLNAWYPGEEGGTAIAEALMGDFNPSGKLTMTFPKATGVLPYYYNIKPTGRLYDYNDIRGPLHQYPFGHGLSYTRFDYRGFRARVEKGCIRVTGSVRNGGKAAGAEVVQLYIRDKFASMTRPLKELKAFSRVETLPGKAALVEFILGPSDLTFINGEMKRIFEPGEFEVMVGSSSEDIRFQETVALKMGGRLPSGKSGGGSAVPRNREFMPAGNI
jgi:beta-glucosidase